MCYRLAGLKKTFISHKKSLEPDCFYHGSVIHSSGKSDSEISHCIVKSNAFYFQISNKVVGKRKIGLDVKIHIFKTVYLPILLYCADNWVLTDRLRRWITATVMKFLYRAIM